MYRLFILMWLLFVETLCCFAQWKVETVKDQFSGKSAQSFMLAGRDLKTEKDAGIGLACNEGKVLGVRLIVKDVVFAVDNVTIRGNQTAVNVKLDDRIDGHFAKDWFMDADQKSIHIPNAEIKKILKTKSTMFIIRDGQQTEHELVFKTSDPPLDQIASACGIKQ